MVVLALILLLLVAVVVVSAVVAGDGTAVLNLVGADIVTTERTLFLTGAASMAVAGLALWLLIKGTKRARARRSEMHRLREAAAHSGGAEHGVSDRGGRDDRPGSPGGRRPHRGDDERDHFESLPRE